MAKDYDASAIEVLSGLEPVRRRPGMYTDTSRPNHLAHEVIDNSVDEALAGHAKHISVTLYKDNSIEVIDDGRGMPVDIHPKEKVSGVELILTRLHAGGKFDGDSYKFSGGLHGVGVSVVNALSKQLECRVRRGGKEYNIGFRDGALSSKLEEVGTVGQRNTGTTLRFWPDPKFFDAPKFSTPQLRHTLKAKAVLCPGLRITFTDEASGTKDEWFFAGDLGAYLADELGKAARLPPEPIVGKREQDQDSVEYALCWAPDAENAIAESYVNLIPTAEGGTHVNGLRSGTAAAVREFCEFRNLLPRGVKLAPEDVGRRALRPLHQDSRAAIRRADQRAARFARCGATRRELCEGCDRHVARAAPRCRRAHRAVCDPERARSHQGGAEGHPQTHLRGSGVAGQARRLRGR